MGIMDNKVCIITGGAGSIGLASAKLMLEEGAKVMLVDNSKELMDKALNELGNSTSVLSSVADVSDAENTRGYIDQTAARWGNIDVLFSNAGLSGVQKPIVEYPEDDFDAVMAVNVRASFLACKYGLPKMNDNGSIIMTSSIMGVTAGPGICAYVTSKHALIGLMRTVAIEAAPRKIRVNALCPGPVDNVFQNNIEKEASEMIGADATEMINSMIPLKRHARPEEIARTVLFLASGQSSFSTGSVFMADGGMNI
jgi:NAD(P)-dependent dehydrogenase (short-subunit alcohol dehydrogenase family)